MSSETSKAKRKPNKKQQQHLNDEEYKKLSKDEEAVAKYLKFNCPTKKANLVGMKVDYFVGSKAIDMLMSSKWATGEKSTPILFTSRDSCKSFLQELLNKELFHRALKVYKEQVESKNSDATPEATPKARKRKTEAAKSVEPSATPTAAASDDKAKRKFKLEMHDDQLFIDANEAYVWIYDPPTTKSIVVGLLLVVGAIGVCLFPLWPSIVREGVYYLSLAGAGFLGFILSLAALKYVIFAVIWLVTMGKVRFWLLPNLTEDVGFFESFQPLYTLKKNTSITADKVEEEKKKAAEEFNKLPLDEQLMKKFDENISDDDDEAKKAASGETVDDNVEEDYDVIQKDVDLDKNN